MMCVITNPTPWHDCNFNEIINFMPSYVSQIGVKQMNEKLTHQNNKKRRKKRA